MHQYLLAKRNNYLLMNKFTYFNTINFYNIRKIELNLSNQEFNSKDKLIYCINVLNKLNRKKPKFGLVVNSRNNILFNFRKKLNRRTLALLFNLLKSRSKVYDYVVRTQEDEYKVEIKGCLIENFLYFEETFCIRISVKNKYVCKLLFLLSTLN